MKQLHTTKTRLAVCLLVSAGVTDAHAQEERLDRLESQIERLQQDMRDSRDTDFRINGFMSTGYARASNNAGYAGVTEESEIRPLTLFAVQGTFDLSDQTSATFQLLSRGQEDARDNWETQLEWGYLSHQMDNGLRVRAGKMRLPLFMFSDSLDLGYAQPFTRAPSAVYDQVTLSSYTGVDATYDFNVLGQSIRTQVFGGHSHDEQPDAQGDIKDLELRNQMGAVVSWTNYTWTLRGVASRADTYLDQIPGDLAQDVDGEFYGLGIEYEEGNILAVSEITSRDVEGVFPDRDGAYATLGYRFGSVMPYVTYAWVETQDDEERAGSRLATLNEKREDYSLGVRWDVMSGVALKADWTHSRAFGDTSGGLDGNEASFLAGQNRFDHTNVYTLKLDAAF